MINVGIIGCGVIAPTHIEGYQKLPDVQVIHLCDLKLERASKLAQTYNIARTTSDYHELLADREIDLVSVCTDHASHAQIVVDALNAGKHVVCEKSAGRVPADLKLMCDSAKSHPELVASGIFQHRFKPANRRLKEMVAEGRFGKILTVNLTFGCLRTAEYYQNDAWRGTIAGEGGGVLINQAIHHLDLLRFILGNVKRVAAKKANFTHQGVIEVEDTVAFTVEFESGALGTVTATSSSAVTWRSNLTIIGDKLTLEYVNETPVYVGGVSDQQAADIQKALTIKDSDQIIGKEYYGSGHTPQLADVVSAICNKRPPEVTLAEAAASAALVMAVYESATTGSWVEVPQYE